MENVEHMRNAAYNVLTRVSIRPMHGGQAANTEDSKPRGALNRSAGTLQERVLAFRKKLLIALKVRRIRGVPCAGKT